MTEELNKAGIYIDDLYYFRVLDTKTSTEANELKEECSEYSNQLLEFQKLFQEFIAISQNFSKDVGKEKIRVVNTQNLLKTISKQRETEQQFYQSKILEKNLKFHRLKTELQRLQIIESEQQEIILNFMQNQ